MAAGPSSPTRRRVRDDRLGAGHGRRTRAERPAKGRAQPRDHRSRWYQLETFTRYKARTLVKVPAPYSSRTCPRCGHVCAENRPKRDVFQCSECAFTGHADVAAAVNLAARHRAAAAGARSAEARETCDRVSGQPVNPHPSGDREHRDSECRPGDRSHAPQEACPAADVTGPLVPASWGIGAARRSRHSRRPRNRHARSPGHGHHDG